MKTSSRMRPAMTLGTLAATLWVAVSLAGDGDSAPDPWIRNDFPAAVKRAQEANQPILVVFR